MKTVPAFEKASMNKASPTDKQVLKRLLRLIVLQKGEKANKDAEKEECDDDDDEEDAGGRVETDPEQERGLSVCAPMDEFGCPLLPDEAMYLHEP